MQRKFHFREMQLYVVGVLSLVEPLCRGLIAEIGYSFAVVLCTHSAVNAEDHGFDLVYLDLRTPAVPAFVCSLIDAIVTLGIAILTASKGTIGPAHQ